ncbi:LLM class flavin-dependent oxidoreductase [Naasia sp. SYSU D00948]|uniref:LLM class flavin-dependent oxidoreductase n=1 Tax=Naasia sp. SYSU D00948 TaxID=2817379 RepID=UPI001B314CBD|nr:LLM class flavin-dependent oxidoreductase [Naasia sp. SYSU D00948]
MPDYGADLRFGAFLTPSAADPEGTVALAVATERAGLDLVTFQDHPYQPRFLDAWTLLSYVAARTTTVGLSANVHSLPLRPPAVLARAAASLDRLSGGRVALGLGAGAFWDAIAAMGGERRSPGEAVQALEEAVLLIRDLWNTDERGGVFRDGRFYRAHGAKRGPRPAHEIPIWIGALRPRMLRLIGRMGDGWLPSLARLDSLDDLRTGNRIIDEAAVESGRDPAAIRRLLNVPAEVADVDSMVSLALEYGISTLIVATDDEDTIRRFGEELAPAVRAAVAAERRRAR